ncbi:ParB N-terminal domain-containing protein [Rubrimonas cliftonensis]|uniref:ParB-like nuclease domain-containing protein n=1 Tax=Rubrimonas cliftonensis TaxID=89524 RepID=A0A1H4BB50_9RHOB|nr:ParB N-terminal domain-containing protein [Rubrimonas cliftonensis]SEA45370.1 ParB-like nuclease domain-containing protein [Rubrimonas cliftonensis]
MIDPEVDEGVGAVSRDSNIPPELYPVLAKLPMQYVMRRRDLGRIRFSADLAMVMVHEAVLPAIVFKNAERADGARLRRLMRLISARGYVPTAPIICRIGQKGKWIVVDGGHRLTALRLLREERWTTRLIWFFEFLGTPAALVDRLRRWTTSAQPMVYFLLFTGPRSLSRVASTPADE